MPEGANGGREVLQRTEQLELDDPVHRGLED